jgi:ketosteroid isomerase-like protein
MEHGDLDLRLRRLEAIEAIRGLAARYVFAIDDRDIDGVAACFAENARFRSRDGRMNAAGRSAIMEQFQRRFSVLGHGAHYTHDHVIQVNDDASAATGLVSLHAELMRNGRPMLASLRYEDVYCVEDGRWKFSDRLLSFLYYLNTEDYLAHFPQRNRNRAYEEPIEADLPAKGATVS